MLGYVMEWEGRRIRLWEEDVLGLPLLELELPQNASPRWENRARRLLERQGVRRLLCPTAGLPGVSTRSLWQSMSAPLALAWLRRNRLNPQKSVVAVSAGLHHPLVLPLCQRLAPQVRAIALDIPQWDDFAWTLERQLGLPVLRGEGDVTVCLSPAPAGENRLLLGDSCPSPPGFSLGVEGCPLPGHLPALPLLAALRDSGRISAEDLRLIETEDNLTPAREIPLSPAPPSPGGKPLHPGSVGCEDGRPR